VTFAARSELPSTPAGSTQLAKFSITSAHTAAHSAVKTQPRAGLKQTKSEAQQSLGATVVQARFPQLANTVPAKQCMNFERNRRTPITRTVFLVTRTQQQEDGFAAASWTIRVWQVTYFQINNANQNGIPAKKT
jgi:hypothetical protein